MSFILKISKCSYSIITRPASGFRNNIFETSTTFNFWRAPYPNNQLHTKPPPPPPPHHHHHHHKPHPPPPPKNGGPDHEKVDNIKYQITFKKPTDVKKLIKDFYSLYGPLFIACYISVSLLSLGFFCTVVWIMVDPIQYMPEVVVTKIGENMTDLTGKGGKFVVAYAIHKLILPIRLFGGIWLTRSLSRIIKHKWRK